MDKLAAIHTVRSFGVRAPESVEEWMGLVKRRIDIILPHLSTLSIPRFEDKDWTVETNGKELPVFRLKDRCYIEYEHGDPISAGTQGLFHEVSHTKAFGKHIIIFWGLTRRADTLLGEIKYHFEAVDEIRVRMILEEITARKVALDEVDKDYLKTIWWDLGDDILAWERKQKKRLDIIRDLSEEVRTTSILMHIAESHRG